MEEAIAPERRLELWAQLRADPAGVQLVGWCGGRGGEDPDGPLTLVGSAAGREVVNESFEKPPVQIQRRRRRPQGPLLIRTVPFRVAVERSRLEDARELVLRGPLGGMALRAAGRQAPGRRLAARYCATAGIGATRTSE